MQARLWKPNRSAMGAASALKEGDTDTWLTPLWIVEPLGPFDFDPCACPACPERIAPNYIAEPADGLREPWKGRAFVNPPYSNTAVWIERAASHGNGVCLVPATVETVVWRSVVWKRARGVFLLHGRTRFCALDGSTTTGRPLRSVL